MEDFISLAEALLCFHAWYKLDKKFLFDEENPEHVPIKEVDASLRRLLALVKTYMPRMNGLGWAIQKFHDMLRLSENMEEFADPGNYDAENGERALKYWAKLPAETSQKCGSGEFPKQCALRHIERADLDKARRVLGVVGICDKSIPVMLPGGIRDDGLEYDGLPEVPKAASKCRFYLARSTRGNFRKLMPPVWSGNDKLRKSYLEISPSLENFICEILPQQYEPQSYKVDKALMEEIGLGGIPISGDTIYFYDFFMELKCPIGQQDEKRLRKTFRCHPNYKNKGPWHDWVIVDYYDHKDDAVTPPDMDHHYPFFEYYCVPARIMVFFKHHDSQTQETSYHAIVHPCSFRSLELWEEASVLTEKWELHYEQPNKNKPVVHPKYAVVDMEDNIVDRCLVVPDRSEPSGVFDLEAMDQVMKKASKKRDKDGEDQTYFSKSFKRITLVKDRKLWGREFVWNPHTENHP